VGGRRTAPADGSWSWEDCGDGLAFLRICFLPILIGAVLVMAVIPIVQSYVL